MAELVNPAKRRYCRQRGYDFLCLERSLDPSRPPSWSKIPAIRAVLGQYDWVVWNDVDTVLWDDRIDLAPFTNVGSDIAVIIQENNEAINCGVFFVRNTAWSFEFLDRVYAQTQFTHDPWWEQRAIIELLKNKDVRDRFLIHERETPRPSFHGYSPSRERDSLFIHFPGIPLPERLSLMENLTRLARVPHEMRILHRGEFPELLNGLQLTGEGAEIGVFYGEYASLLLSRWQGTMLHLIDPWKHQASYRDKTNVSDTEFEVALDQARRNLEQYDGRFTIHRQLSTDAAAGFLDASLDFVYIDADHSYESISRDIATWAKKVRPGGVLAGHDFLDGELREGAFAVKTAVCEFERRMGAVVGVTTEKWPSWYTIIRE